jgi:hypothetical protein
MPKSSLAGGGSEVLVQPLRLLSSSRMKAWVEIACTVFGTQKWGPFPTAVAATAELTRPSRSAPI